MIKKKCLKCGKDFEAEKDTAKYCSVSCRVMYNRNNPKPKKEVIDPLIQAQVLYNAVLEMVGKVNYGVVPTNNSYGESGSISRETWQHTETKPTERSFQQLMNAIPDLDTHYEFQQFAKEVEYSTILTGKQKELLLLNMRQSKM